MLKRVGMTGGQATIGLAFTVAAILANFVFQVVTGRYLGPSEFSILSVSLVFLATGGIAASGLQVVVARNVAASSTISDPPKRLDRYTATSMIVFCAAGLLIGAASPLLSVMFNSPTAIFLAVGLFMPFTALLAIVNGRLQGKQKLVLLTGLSLVLSVIKLSATLMVIHTGGQVMQILLVIVLVSGFVVVLSFHLTRNTPRVNLSALSQSSWTAVGVQVIFWLILTSDVVIARVTMTGDLAGGFAVADTFAKVTLLAPSLILIVLLPRVANQRLQGKSSRRLISDALAATLILMVPAALALIVLGNRMIAYIFGSDFVISPFVIGMLAIATIPLGMASVLLQYHLSTNDFGYAFRLAIVLVLMSVGFCLTSASMFAYCVCYALGGIAAVLVLLPRSAYSSQLLQLKNH